MKLKKLFSAKIFRFSAVFSVCFFCSVLMLSCTSNSVSLIPGASAANAKGIVHEYINIGDTYFSLGKYDKAADYYKLALSDKENYWAVYYKLAKTYIAQSKWSDAKPIFEDILKRDPQNASIKASLAFIHIKLGEYDQALSIYDELNNSDKSQSEYLQNTISIHLLKEDLEQASSNFELLKELYPDCQNIEKFESAINELKKKKEEAEKLEVSGATETTDSDKTLENESEVPVEA